MESWKAAGLLNGKEGIEVFAAPALPVHGHSGISQTLAIIGVSLVGHKGGLQRGGHKRIFNKCP